MKIFQTLICAAICVAGLGLLGCESFIGEGPIGESPYGGPRDKADAMIPSAPPPVVAQQQPPQTLDTEIWTDGDWNPNGEDVSEHANWTVSPREHAAPVQPSSETWYWRGWRF